MSKNWLDFVRLANLNFSRFCKWDISWFGSKKLDFSQVPVLLTRAMNWCQSHGRPWPIPTKCSSTRVVRDGRRWEIRDFPKNFFLNFELFSRSNTRWSVTHMTTASPCATWRMWTRWAFTQEVRKFRKNLSGIEFFKKNFFCRECGCCTFSDAEQRGVLPAARNCIEGGASSGHHRRVQHPVRAEPAQHGGEYYSNSETINCINLRGSFFNFFFNFQPCMVFDFKWILKSYELFRIFQFQIFHIEILV